MDNPILQMLAEYKCQTTRDYENALKEIMQEIALLGLWRAKFYEHALFYGGSALRILYGLPRFSEDLDFSLLKPQQKFDLGTYLRAIKEELQAFGLEVEVIAKTKSFKSPIESAFIKTDTWIELIQIKSPSSINSHFPNGKILKIKIEVDTNPPGKNSVEVLDLMRPIPFQVKTMPLSDLFAGKLHAVLGRAWENRVKGRDFFDYLWYLGRKTPVNLEHLEARLLQSGHLEGKLTSKVLKQTLRARFESIDIDKARLDVAPFLRQREREVLQLWSEDYFCKTIEKLQII